ncbi:LuxR C-terminal-related transcriptional regulator [Lentzea waywayandensis]|uniref:LuxR C-terminal-related transcriptional regulator n=1 Tax=Lentzea waywayandensis TaxID=84724 RepID=UPI0015A50DAB|nr:LuxR C-terminal-related transcriptional regulator [Lentzea waywayandensis]
MTCPAGFGKSTLLAAWAQDEAQRRPVAWMSLDEGDDDAVVLWSHLIEALGRACPAIDHETLAGLATSAPILEVMLPRAVNELVAAQAQLVLVLDDFHRLNAGPARDSVVWFVEHAPASVQVVLATRTDPALPLSALRARGHLLELRADDLRFTPEEAYEFLNGRLDLELARGDVDLLVARTEGWPAAIYLAALSLSASHDKHALVRQFDGTSRHVVDFLSEEVLAGYGPEIRGFMRRISVLDRLSGPLCDVVLERQGSADTLNSLAASNLFLVPLDDRHEWFRFHQLFREILLLELRRDEPGLICDLHRRAQTWHAEFGTVEESVHHAFEARAWHDAAQLVAQAWVGHVNAGRTSTVLDWLRRFPEEALLADRRLLLIRAWVSAFRGTEHDTRAAIRQIQQAGGADEGPVEGFASLESSLAVLQASFVWGDVSAIIEHGTRAAELEGLDSPWRPVVSWALGWGHYCRGELDQAERWLTETRTLGPHVDQWIVVIGAVAELSMIAGRRGLRSLQLRLATEAAGLAREHGLFDAREVGEVRTALGLALSAHGRDEEALPELEQGVLLRRLWGQQLEIVDGLIALAPAVAIAGDRGRAADLFDEADEVLSRCADAGELPARLAAARRATAVGGQPATAPGTELTERELVVLRYLRSTLSEREIAQQLSLSVNTVHSHVKSIYRKLGVGSRAEAVAHLSPR